MAMNPRPDSADTAIVACYFGLARRPSLNADYELSDVLASQGVDKRRQRRSNISGEMNSSGI